VKPRNLNEAIRIWKAREDGLDELQKVRVRCSKCGEVFNRRLSEDWFICACGKIVEIARCVVAKTKEIH
jgi:hypothetical protein